MISLGDSSDSKRCTKCGEVKVLGDFSPDRRTALGFKSRCKACCNSDQIALNALNPSRVTDYNARYYRNNREKERIRCSRYHARQKALRKFFQMHASMARITEYLNQRRHDD